MLSFVRRSLLALGVGAALLTGPGALAQFESQNVTLLKFMPLSAFPSNPETGNDCWGYVSPSGREYALMGISTALAVVEITDPVNPVLIAEIRHSTSLWGDVKVYRDHCYVSNESSGGIQVISLADVDNGNVTLVRSLTTNGLSKAHNVFVDEVSGFLYVVGANINGGSPVVFDLTDPANPTLAGQISGPYTHDIQVVTFESGPYAGRQIAYCSNGQTAFDIVDVTNKSNMFRTGRVVYPGLNYCHQGWLSEDRNYFFLNDELDEQNGYTNVTLTRVFDVSDITIPNLVSTFTSGRPSIDHNLYVNGNFVFEANYRSGLRIFDATDPLDPVQTGWFDTYPGDDAPSFDGAWSTYPYFPSGTVIISDITRGLFIVDVTASQASLTFDYPNGRPELINPAGGTTMRMDVTPRGSVPQPGTGVLHVNDGNGWVDIPMGILGDNSYEALFPATPCGTTVQYYTSAETTRGQIVVNPSDAPASTYTALSAGSLNVLLDENFEADNGWTVINENVSDGAWVRGVPANGGTRGDPPTDSDGSGNCYITGNGPNQDLDGGPTRLISPVFSLTGQSTVLVSYDRWFYNDDGDDFFDAEVSNDGGNNWTLMKRISREPGWRNETLNITDFVPLTSQMRFRFSAADNPNNSVTEAGLDAFKLIAIDCGSGGGLTLAVSGTCRNQGGALFSWSQASSNVTLGLVFARNTGSFVVPSGVCSGTILGLGSDHIQLARRFNSGAGAGSFNATLPNGACGGYFQLVQTSNCETSNVAQAPN